jgi:hypothetical protein
VDTGHLLLYHLQRRRGVALINPAVDIGREFKSGCRGSRRGFRVAQPNITTKNIKMVNQTKKPKPIKISFTPMSLFIACRLLILATSLWSEV